MREIDDTKDAYIQELIRKLEARNRKCRIIFRNPVQEKPKWYEKVDWCLHSAIAPGLFQLHAVILNVYQFMEIEIYKTAYWPWFIFTASGSFIYAVVMLYYSHYLIILERRPPSITGMFKSFRKLFSKSK